MEALFIIPTMVSPNINPRLVPVFSKLVERNILMTGGATFRAAVLKKYSGPFKTIRSESTLVEAKGGKGGSKQDNKDKAAEKGAEAIVDLLRQTTAPAEKQKPMPTLTEPEKIEIPQGISFFHTIGIAPTILEIPVTMKRHILGGGLAERVIRIGMKCVPYTIDGIENFVAMMRKVKNKKKVDTLLKRKMRSILPKFKDYQMTGTTMDVFNAPNSIDLANPSKLAKRMSPREPSTWSTLTIFSTEDFEDMDLRESLLNYKELVKAGWGDMVVYNVAKDSVNFCTIRMNACLDIPMAYVKQIFNLSNVLSYADVARWSKPFGVSSLGKALSDNTIMDFKSEDTEARILEIIRG